jgi:uncharacterized protein (TIGR02611 family)
MTDEDGADGFAEDDADGFAERVDRRIERARRYYEDRGLVLRALWVVAGFLVVLIGIAMIVIPGPVTVVVPLGLTMLAVVFGWARRLLRLSLEKGEEAKHRLEEASTAMTVLTLAASVSLAAAAVTLVLFWTGAL